MRKRLPPELTNVPLTSDAQLLEYFKKIRDISREARQYGISVVYALSVFDPFNEKESAVWGGNGSDMATAGLAHCLNKWASDLAAHTESTEGFEETQDEDVDGGSTVVI